MNRNSRKMDLSGSKHCIALPTSRFPASYLCLRCWLPLFQTLMTSTSRSLEVNSTQLHWRCRIFCNWQDQQDPWFLVFRLLDKEDLRHATALLLEAKQAHPGHHAGWTQTSVPFPCLDCMAELEASHCLVGSWG
eukprot:g10679.t1